MKTLTDVSVIIPTIAIKAKAALLMRAVESIRHSAAGQIRIIAVVNGGRADPDVCQWLQAQPDIHYERIAAPSSPLAIFRGRALVQTPFFSMLDDDDEYLIGGTDLKLAALASHTGADIVVTSGFRRVGEVDRLAMSEIEQVPLAPLVSLFQSAWLSSCNTLYRSSSFPQAFFADPHPYAEWTWLAFKLALAGKQIAAINQPTFRIHDTPGSLSKSKSYDDAYQSLYQRMLDLEPPTDIARTIKARIGSDWHDQSVRALSRRRRLDAIACHLRSLMLPGGLRYLTYTRRLFLD
ncbi:MAG: glycosyltransferase family 2 protein [Polaromonas sp.]|nr:glycosyltransferase family 2 protein [Polaromonas sp.]